MKVQFLVFLFSVFLFNTLANAAECRISNGDDVKLIIEKMGGQSINGKSFRLHCGRADESECLLTTEDENPVHRLYGVRVQGWGSGFSPAGAENRALEDARQKVHQEGQARMDVYCSRLGYKHYELVNKACRTPQYCPSLSSTVRCKEISCDFYFRCSGKIED